MYTTGQEVMRDIFVGNIVGRTVTLILSLLHASIMIGPLTKASLATCVTLIMRRTEVALVGATFWPTRIIAYPASRTL